MKFDIILTQTVHIDTDNGLLDDYITDFEEGLFKREELAEDYLAGCEEEVYNRYCKIDYSEDYDELVKKINNIIEKKLNERI